jgi:hypothetical protein
MVFLKSKNFKHRVGALEKAENPNVFGIPGSEFRGGFQTTRNRRF